MANKQKIQQAAKEIGEAMRSNSKQLEDYIIKNQNKYNNIIINTVIDGLPKAKNGRVDNNEETTRFIQQFNRKVKDGLMNSGLSTNVNKYFGGLADAMSMNLDLANNYFTKSEQRTKIVAAAINQLQKDFESNIQSALFGGGLDAQLLNSLYKELINARNTRAIFSDTVGAIKNVLERSKSADATSLASYYIRVIRDQQGAFNGWAQFQFKNEFDLNAYLYTGAEVENTREQCIFWSSAPFLLIEDLDKTIDWALNNGTGMIKATTPDTFPCYRGGWNCLHECFAFYADAEDIAEYKEFKSQYPNRL